jgi:peptide/nickel transport system substrate-binding protein
MKHRRNRAIVPVIASLLALGLAACGSSSKKSSGTSTSTSGQSSVPLKAGEDASAEGVNAQGKKGGMLTAYSSEDFLHLDPGAAYFSLDYTAVYATQRTLLIYPPNSTSILAPNLATEVPTAANGGITDGGLTVTVHIQQGVKFSPPVNREVTSADVEYAIDRAANPNVSNGYFLAYFGNLQGAAQAKGGKFPGVTTPDKFTIQFHLTKPTDQTLIGALQMPATAPVPEELAGPLDKHSPSLYGSAALVATGPYMFKNDPKTGKVDGIGYQTGKSATLIRNPNWDPNTYTSAYKPPAYLDQININIGGEATVIGQQVLKGSGSVQVDTPAQSIVKLAYESYPSQITFTTAGGDHYGGLDTTSAPFNNVNLRRAVWAAVDREAIVKARGGPLVAEPLTHFITPGTDGYEQAGGAAGPNYPWNTNVNGNMTEATSLMKAAGYPSGKYTGTTTLTVVGGNNGNAPAVAEIVVGALNALGFKTHLSLVDQSTMYGKYCGVPKQHINVCPSSGWIRDFDNPLTVLYVPFNGNAIVPTNNSNFSNFNDPTINNQMTQASLIQDPGQAAVAWANIDKELVNLAVGVPEEFDNQPNISASNVADIGDLWNVGSVDYAYTSIK